MFVLKEKREENGHHSPEGNAQQQMAAQRATGGTFDASPKVCKVLVTVCTIWPTLSLYLCMASYMAFCGVGGICYLLFVFCSHLLLTYHYLCFLKGDDNQWR